MPYFDGYNIDAHRDDISDLPERFISALQVAMEDKSYGNDECATFGMIHPDKNKIYHLCVSSQEDVEDSGNEFTRFYFNIVWLFEDAVYNENCNSYLVETNLDEVEKIIETNSVDELAEKLSEIFPAFKDVWESNS